MCEALMESSRTGSSYIYTDHFEIETPRPTVKESSRFHQIDQNVTHNLTIHTVCKTTLAIFPYPHCEVDGIETIVQ
jgi:hypothetical protein